MTRCILLAALVALVVIGPAQAQEILYGADGAGGQLANLYILNPATGAIVSTVGPIGFSVTGLAVDPTTGILYGTTGTEAGPSQEALILINKTTGAGTLVGANVEGPVADITFTSDGTLFGWSEGSDAFVTVNKATGLATIVNDPGIFTRGSGIAANAADTIFFAGGDDDGELRTVDRTTGALTTVATLNGTLGVPIAALAFSSGGTLFGVRPSVSRGPGPRSLITINTGTGAITVRGSTVDDLDAIAFDLTQVPTLPSRLFALLGVLLLAAGTWWLTRAPRTA